MQALVRQIIEQMKNEVSPCVAVNPATELAVLMAYFYNNNNPRKQVVYHLHE